MEIVREGLRLVAATPEMLRAELAHRESLGALLGCEVTSERLPELDEASLEWLLEPVRISEEARGWFLWFWVVLAEGGQPRLGGAGGFKGPPDSHGCVEVGYTVLPSCQRQGLASRAVAALTSWAFDSPPVRAVLAETYPRLIPSLGVLQKLGFANVGAGSGPDILRFAMLRGWWVEPPSPK